jgi:hypothetical protein
MVERLIADTVAHPVWLGDVDQVEVVDSLLRVWFTLAAVAAGQQMGRNLAFKLLR